MWNVQIIDRNIFDDIHYKPTSQYLKIFDTKLFPAIHHVDTWSFNPFLDRSHPSPAQDPGDYQMFCLLSFYRELLKCKTVSRLWRNRSTPSPDDLQVNVCLCHWADIFTWHTNTIGSAAPLSVSDIYRLQLVFLELMRSEGQSGLMIQL